MKKESLLLIILIFLAAVNTRTAQGAWPKKKAASEEKSSPSAVKEEKKEGRAPVQPASPALAARREAEKKAKETLASKEWLIKINQTGGKKPKSEIDTLTFTPEGKVSSKNYSAKGYPASNFTVTLQSGRSTIVWETMQTNPEAGVLFWRGELDNEFMNGSLTLQTKKEAIEEYSFVSAPSEAKSETPQPKPPESKEKKGEAKVRKTESEKK